MPLYYRDDYVTLYHGDCLTEHREWLTADVLVTDPPYGYSHKSGGGPRGNASWKNTNIQNDGDTSARDTVLEMWGYKPAVVFGSWKRARPIGTRALLVWDKGGHAGMGDLSMPWKPNFEDIYILGSGFKGKRESGILSGYHVPANETAGRTHPHEKPSNLMSFCRSDGRCEICDPPTRHNPDEPCPTCSGPIRETVNMRCETCGRDFMEDQ